jgi:SPP1 gp7 family putative phage head morphogenesis protein
MAAADAPVKPLLNKYEAEMFLQSIYVGDFNPEYLPKSFYLLTAKQLEDQLYRGFGKVLNDEQREKIRKMRRNVYFFAAAKTYTLVSEIEKLRENKAYDQFRRDASSILFDFIGAYFFAEKDHTKMCGKTAKKWLNVSSKTSTPYLEYVTMKDGKVRPAHVYLDGIIRQQDDNFWNTFMPPNGWNCRCKVKSYQKGENTSLQDFDLTDALKNIPTMFRMNFGKEGIIFPFDHPYFKNADRLLARNNFNLPLP